MPTSGGPGVARCWARKSVRFYARGPPRRKFRPRPKGCSASPRDVYILPESTDTHTVLADNAIRSRREPEPPGTQGLGVNVERRRVDQAVRPALPPSVKRQD